MHHPDAAFWNDLAEQYAAKPVENPDAFERKIAITRALMRPDDVVLDIGCGTGSLALRLADAAAVVHGLDISEEMIRIANAKAAAAGALDVPVHRVQFHCGPFDARFEALAPGSLSGVCAYSLLHLVADRGAALAQIYDLLTPGGYFVSSTVCLGSSAVPYRPLLTVMRWLGKAPHVYILTAEQLRQEMQAAGFVDIVRHDVGAKERTSFVVARKPS